MSESANAIEALGGDVLDAMGVEEGNQRPAWRRVLANAANAADLDEAIWKDDQPQLIADNDRGMKLILRTEG